MNENEFWCQIWKLIAMCSCVLILTIGSCTAFCVIGVSRDNKIAKSADPIGLSCALTSNITICTNDLAGQR